jgi:hypothetical protein
MGRKYGPRRAVVAAVLAAVALVGGAGVSVEARDQYRASSQTENDDPGQGWCHCDDPT